LQNAKCHVHEFEFKAFADGRPGQVLNSCDNGYFFYDGRIYLLDAG